MTASSSFAPGGGVTGSGGYATGTTVTLGALVADGYRFTGWSENGTVVSTSAGYSFSATANRTLIANFAPVMGISSPTSGTLDLTWPESAAGWVLQENPDLNPANWTLSTLPITTSGGRNSVTVNTSQGRMFFRLAGP